MKEKEIARERECDTDYAIPMTLPPDPTRSAAPSCRYWCAAGFRACCDSGRDGSCQHGIFRLPHAPLPGTLARQSQIERMGCAVAAKSQSEEKRRGRFELLLGPRALYCPLMTQSGHAACLQGGPKPVSNPESEFLSFSPITSVPNATAQIRAAPYDSHTQESLQRIWRTPP